MTVRELRDKLNRIPEEYLDLEVYTYNEEYGNWKQEDIVASVNIVHSKIHGGVFLGIGECFSKNYENLWPNPDKEKQ